MSEPPPEPPPEPPSDTPPDVREAALATLRERAPVWSATPLDARIDLLQEMTRATLAVAPHWAAAAAAAKGIGPASRHAGEDWGSGPVTLLRSLTLLEATLRDIAATSRPRPPAVRASASGGVVVDVLPAAPSDRLLFPGFSAEVRLAAGVGLGDALARMGRIYRPGHEPAPGVSLVLGAGNVSSIGPMDVLTQLFAHDRVVLLKPSPVNAHLGAHLGEALAPLVEGGFLRIVHGGDEVGAELTTHRGIDHVHVTGSRETHDAVVAVTAGSGRRVAAPGMSRPASVTSELGNVTPVIVVPGPYSAADIRFQGDNIASMVVDNAGFNCVSARVVVQHRAWSQRRALLDAVRASLAGAEPRVAYYPGARERWQAVTSAHPDAEFLGPPGDDRVPFTLVAGLDPADEHEAMFTSEAFCGVLGEVALDASHSIPDYLAEAVAFCNDVLSGTLAATIIVHPRSLADPEVASALERAVDELRYGTIVVNHWPGAAFALGCVPWGGAPGGADEDIGSGRGFVHNTYLLEDVEKSVVRGPFRPKPTPVWFHTHRTAADLLPALATYIATRDPRRLPGLLVRALRG